MNDNWVSVALVKIHGNSIELFCVCSGVTSQFERVNVLHSDCFLPLVVAGYSSIGTCTCCMV